MHILSNQIRIRSLYDAVPCVQNEGSPLILVDNLHPTPVAENQLEAHLGRSCLYRVAHLLWERNMLTPNLKLRLAVS